MTIFLLKVIVASWVRLWASLIPPLFRRFWRGVEMPGLVLARVESLSPLQLIHKEKAAIRERHLVPL